MNRMPEAAPEPNPTLDTSPAFFRLGPVNNARVKDVLHHIQRFGMGDARSTHRLLSLFQPEEFTDDPFHVLGSNGKPQTLWDQVAQAASDERHLTGDQQVALMSIKRYALQSLTEDPVLHESVHDAARAELQEYDGHLAKIIDPDDPASARFFDAVSAAGRAEGRTAKAGGTAYLVLNLMGCVFGTGINPTVEATTSSPPAIIQTVPGIETPSATPIAISPELTSTPPAIIGSLPDVTALSGLAPGVGGTGELVTNPFDGSIQAAINTVHFGVVHAGNAVSVESAHNDTDLCFSAIPANIYDPDHVSDPKGDLLLRQENGVAKYGFNQVLAEVLVPRDTDTATYACVLGYALQGNADFKAGTLRMLLVRTNSNGSIDVVGSMQAGFSITEDVQVRGGAVFVSGEKQDWTLFPNMVLTTPTETPTPTEVYVPRQVELVFAPDGTTVPDSCKVIPVATADNTLTLNGQPLPDGTVIDTSINVTMVSSGKYQLPTLLITARAVAIEKISPIQRNNTSVDQYLICFNVKLPSGDNVVMASVFRNNQMSGFENTLAFILPDVDIAGVEIDQTKPNATPYIGINNATFINLFTSGQIIGQQVLLPFSYNFPPNDGLAYQNPARSAIVEALKDGRLPPEVGFDPVVINTIGTSLVMPKKLIP
jgi:hypothetical protein